MKPMVLEEDKTIYYPVHERILKLKNDNIDYQLTTEHVFFMDKVVVKATLTVFFDHKPPRTFTGHGMGNLKEDKIMQKCETIAWGRAIAAYGIAIHGGIASSEEMEGVDKQKQFLDGLTPVAITPANVQDELNKVMTRKRSRTPDNEK
jgi:hypothetical protein